MPSSFADPGALTARLSATGARWAVARKGPAVDAVLGAPAAVCGAWCVYARK